MVVFPKMKLPSFLFSVLFLGISPLIRGETLFEDTFGQFLPRSAESRGGFNVGIEARQSGPLAPKKYTHNGQGWQSQTQFWPRDGVICRLFPRSTWLAASPSWELDASDGNYEVVFTFSHPNQNSTQLSDADLQRPPAPVAETIVIIGQPAPEGEEELRIANGIVVVQRTSTENPSLFRRGGQLIGEFEPAAQWDGEHTIRIRWTQKGGIVSNIEAECNGQVLKDDGGYPLAAPTVQFGGRGRLNAIDYETSGINCLNVLQLTYSKE
jgi:hypothetical protein